MKKHALLFLDMFIAYFVVYLLCFMGNLFYYLEDENWVKDLLGLSLLSPILTNYGSILFVEIFARILKNNPKHDKFAFLLVYSTVALMAIISVLAVAKFSYFLVLLNFASILVFLFYVLLITVALVYRYCWHFIENVQKPLTK